MKKILVVLTVLLTAGVIQVSNAATLLGPTPYLSFNDSPFNHSGFTNFYLENFEDGSLNTPGVSANYGAIGYGNGYVDSVDGDDGKIDGAGWLGHSWALNVNMSPAVFTFDKTVLGSLPTHAGIVWTDVHPSYGTIIFEAFDANGVSLGSISAYLGDGGTWYSGTAEDRFFGIINEGGISKISIAASQYVSWEVDHLQYGFAPTTPPPPASTPEPASMLLLGLGLAGLAKLRRIFKRWSQCA